jgi:hypothetical protein
MRIERRAAGALVAVLALLLPVPGFGYDAQVHQRLTFLAAKTLNRCLEGSSVPRVTPLQVRFVATSNMGLADSNALARLFRWSYYDAADSRSRRLLWLVNTRFTEHFDQLVRSLKSAPDEADRYRELGRIVSYVQLVSAPTRALPVYSARFWRGSWTDRFDRYRVDESTLQEALAKDDCSFLDATPRDYRSILQSVARDTREAVQAPMDGLPATWEAFWRVGESLGDFGEYGPAGNSFGHAVEFPCGGNGAERCVLVRRDPLYAEFALQRQLAAVRGTAQAMFLFQTESSEGAAHVE